MSSDKQTAEAKVPAQQAVAPEANPLVIEQESYSFGSYQDDATFKDPLDAKPLFSAGFNSEAYDVRWFRHNEQEDAKDRYFTKVTAGVHGKAGWFKPEVFDKLRGSIGRGHEFMSDGKPEVELFIRTKAAAQAEQDQMLAMSAERRAAKEEKLQANVDGMQSVLAPSGSRVIDNSKRVTSSNTWPKN